MLISNPGWVLLQSLLSWWAADTTKGKPAAAVCQLCASRVVVGTGAAGGCV